MIANFSSPHEFTFDDGTVLPACSKDHSRRMMLDAIENEDYNGVWTDIKLTFGMSPEVRAHLTLLEKDDLIDIILVPLPVFQLIAAEGDIGKARVCRVADRVTKVIHHDRFCI